MAGNMVLEVNDDNFKKEILESELTCLVDFWAAWCMPCRMIAPVVEKIAQEYSGKAKVCKVNIDQAQKAASQYGVMSIPTLGIFKNGELVDKIVGVVPEEGIKEKLDSYL